MANLIRCSPEAGWDGLARVLKEACAGDEIVLDAGDYLATSRLTLPSGIRLVGNSQVNLIRSASDGGIFLIDGSENIHIFGLYFASTLSAEINDGHFLTIRNACAVTIENCVFNGYGNTPSAIIAIQSREIIIRSCSATEFSGACIAFLSSKGIIERNECWGSKTRSGIIAIRDSSTPDVPSEVQVRGNRCHDNARAGIGFASSNGAIEGNECWGNKTSSGILALRDQNSLDAPSEVQIRSNRCHANEQAGIAFLSSNGAIEDNECWGNKTGPGIIVMRNPSSPGAPSEVQVRGNRCHANEQAGIAFLSSSGVIEDNELGQQDRSRHYSTARPTLPRRAIGRPSPQ